METIIEEKDIYKLERNRIIGSTPRISDSVIKFVGDNNVIFCENESLIEHSNIKFSGSNSLLYISSQRNSLNLSIDMYNDSVFFVGENCWFNGKVTAICSERKHILIGNNCLFSYGIGIRTSDAHLIYSVGTRKRMNHSKSVFIGDWVWIGQNSLILKGSQIHSGSIIGANSVLSNKKVASNCSYAGNPCRMVSQGVFWLPNNTNSFTEDLTARFETCNEQNNIFSYSEEEQITFESMDKLFSEEISSVEKAEKIKIFLEKNGGGTDLLTNSTFLEVC